MSRPPRKHRGPRGTCWRCGCPAWIPTGFCCARCLIRAEKATSFIIAPTKMPELVDLKRLSAPPKATHETFDDYGITIVTIGKPKP